MLGLQDFKTHGRKTAYAQRRKTLWLSFSLFTVILFAATFGTLIPLVLNRYNIDPALATGSFITTLNDIVGLFIYFTVGMLLYHI